ncbi:MAG: hypothetical protein ABI595_06340 [Actinomycetota bacterium]
MTRELGLVGDGESGGTHTSRTIMLKELTALLGSVPDSAAKSGYAEAIVDQNILAKKSASTRNRSLRYLKELYLLDPGTILFRGLRDLWSADPAALPLLALLCALARDPLLRATSDLISDLAIGSSVEPDTLAAAVTTKYPGSYSTAVAAKVGRNVASSWGQAGLVSGRYDKVRSQADSRPAAVAYALMLGHLSDARGLGLFRTPWARVLDRSEHELLEQASAASQRGWIDLRRAGEVVEVSFEWLLRPIEEPA